MQISTIIDKQFVGTHELRKNLTLLLKSLKTEGEPFVVTHQGKPAAVLTSVENYTQMLEMIDELQLAIKELADKAFIKTLVEEKKKIKSGKGIDAGKLYKDLGI